MRTRITVQRCVAIVLYLLHFSAYGSTQDLVAIEHVVVDYIKQQHPTDAALNVELQRLDSRLQLAACGEDLKVSWSPGSRDIGRTTVSVSCSMPKPWRIFVRASVEKETLTWVLNAAVRKGEVLSRQLVSQQSVMLGQGGHFGLPLGVPITDIEPWLGQVFAQAMQAGKIVGDQSLQLPNLVTKGDPVSITYKSSHLAIRAKGVALESGALQQKIAVKNSASNKVFDAIVIGRSNVAISP
ncbi:MAG: flagellar basal body P-ring formation chaperone FlgA [Granulosicoccaceae bacterium]